MSTARKLFLELLLLRERYPPGAFAELRKALRHDDAFREEVLDVAATVEMLPNRASTSKPASKSQKVTKKSILDRLHSTGSVQNLEPILRYLELPHDSGDLRAALQAIEERVRGMTEPQVRALSRFLRTEKSGHEAYLGLADYLIRRER